MGHERHCWHDYHGPIWMVLRDGLVIQRCCTCSASRTIHTEHRNDERPGMSRAPKEETR